MKIILKDLYCYQDIILRIKNNYASWYTKSGQKKKKTIEVSETYCILTCRCCGGTEEILGDVNMRNLSNGWDHFQ